MMASDMSAPTDGAVFPVLVELCGAEDDETNRELSSTNRFRTINSILKHVKDERDKVNARLITERESRYEAACADVEATFPIPEKKKSVVSAKKKKAIATARRKRQEAFDALQRPVPPHFAVLSIAYPGAREAERAKDQVVVRSSHDLKILYREWEILSEQRQELLALRAFRDMLVLLNRHESLSDAILFELFQLLHNKRIEHFAWDALCQLIEFLARPASAAPSEGLEVDRYRGLASWGLAKYPSVLNNAINNGVSLLSMVLHQIRYADSLRSSKPSIEALQFVCAAALLTRNGSHDPVARSLVAQECFIDLGRRANDGFVLLSSLVLLNNTLEGFFEDTSVEDESKRVVLGKLSNHFASPQLIVHDVETKGVMARTDLSTIILACSAISKACLRLPIFGASELLCGSGAIRRLLALGEWSYEVLMIANSSQNSDGLGQIVVPHAQKTLRLYTSALRSAFEMDPQDDIRVNLIRVVLIQCLFLLSVATRNIQDQLPLTETSKPMFLELAKLFCKTIRMIRSEWIVISEGKAAERLRKIEAAEAAAELAAMKAIETGNKNTSTENQNGLGEDGSQDGSFNNTIIVDDHPQEWVLRNIELCALRGFRSLLDAKYLSAEDLESHFCDEYLPDLASFLECVSEDARRCSIDIINRFICIIELMEDQKQAKSLLERISIDAEPVLIVDMLLENPHEDNVAFLLCRVTKYSGNGAATEIINNVLSLIDHRTIAMEDHYSSSDLLIITYLLDVILYAAQSRERRHSMGTQEGGCAVEVILGCLTRMLAITARPHQAYDCITHACMALTLILQDVNNLERFANARGVQLLCALVEEFGRTSARLKPGPEKGLHYEVLLHALKLWRVIIMSRSVHFQQEVLCAEVMDTLFTLACADFEDDTSEYLKQCAQAKRLAASILVALPFKRDVAEPCLIAIARRFICRDYTEILPVAVEQQSFGARMFSRVEISETGHELLRRTHVIKALIDFVCHEPDGDLTLEDHAQDDARKESALIGLLYLCAEDAKTQVYVCSTALYRLLKSAWVLQSKYQHTLVGKLLEQLARNKMNRTKMFKAEMRARAIAVRFHKQILTDASSLGQTRISPRPLSAERGRTNQVPNQTSSQEKHLLHPQNIGTNKLEAIDTKAHSYGTEWTDPECESECLSSNILECDTEQAQIHYDATKRASVLDLGNGELLIIEEDSVKAESIAADDMHELVRLQHEYSQWLDKQTPSPSKKTSRKSKSSSPKALGRIPAIKSPKCKQAKLPATKGSLEASSLWTLKESIFTPHENLSAVACSNGRLSKHVPREDLFVALNQPAKLLWTNRKVVEAAKNTEGHAPQAHALGTSKSDKLWRLTQPLDPFQELVEQTPLPDHARDMDVPDLSFLQSTRGSPLGLVAAPKGFGRTQNIDGDDDELASTLIDERCRALWAPGLCELGTAPRSETIVRPRAHPGTDEWLKEIEDLKCWAASGVLTVPVIPLWVADISMNPNFTTEAKLANTGEESKDTEIVIVQEPLYSAILSRVFNKKMDMRLELLCPLYGYYSARSTLDPRSLLEDLNLEPLPKKDPGPSDLAKFLELVRDRMNEKVSEEETASILARRFSADLTCLYLWQINQTSLRPIIADHWTMLLQIISEGESEYSLENHKFQALSQLIITHDSSLRDDVRLGQHMCIPFLDAGDDLVAMGVMLCWIAPGFAGQPARLQHDPSVPSNKTPGSKNASSQRQTSVSLKGAQIRVNSMETNSEKESQEQQLEEGDPEEDDSQPPPISRALRSLLIQIHDWVEERNKKLLRTSFEETI